MKEFENKTANLKTGIIVVSALALLTIIFGIYQYQLKNRLQ